MEQSQVRGAHEIVSVFLVLNHTHAEQSRAKARLARCRGSCDHQNKASLEQANQIAVTQRRRRPLFIALMISANLGAEMVLSRCNSTRALIAYRCKTIDEASGVGC